MEKTLTIAHSPDPDDAFMFYGFVGNRVLPEGWKARHVLKDIQTLNRHARRAQYDVTAISAAAFPSVARHYWILSVGASVGRGYGPVVLCRPELRRRFAAKDWSGLRVATPGPETTALLLLRLARPGFTAIDTPFDEILSKIESGSVDGGLVIHEGQITFDRRVFKKVMDMGQWWRSKTGLPIPLGLDVVKKKRGRAFAHRVAGYIKDSIQLAYREKDRSVAYARKFGRGIDAVTGEKFVKMYVNRDTLNLGPEGEQSLRTLYRLAWARRLIPSNPDFSIISPIAR